MVPWNTPCAACKIQRRKCTEECVFAPYFPPDNPQKFAYVHKVFGASNVAKLLNEVNASQREDAVKSLAYEAEARLRDPVYGCVGLISLLQHNLKSLQIELNNAKKELASFIGPQVMLPPSPPPPPLLSSPPPPNSFFPSSQRQELFTFNIEPPSASSSSSSSSHVSFPFSSSSTSSQFQIHPFHNQLMLSSSQKQQPNHSFFSQKMFKSERANLEEGAGGV
ncbi:LOB domain-containing protein 36-like isoform X2 [Cicer arietinum]|uniref:LOB domain-containing protein 36-like isoform X2 n=1 Tax=Cicer arietinum TaxID=3827 RepID=A0A3Q7XSB2_CICAR|nr:LOB domain-containing protein 36-like isoform X2 [Cicer arietinum]